MNNIKKQGGGAGQDMGGPEYIGEPPSESPAMGNASAKKTEKLTLKPFDIKKGIGSKPVLGGFKPAMHVAPV
jgi:hypothetical protein